MPKPLDPELVDQIRASLYAGKGVRLFGDDEPTTKLEASNPMTADGDAYFTGKLDKIAELVDKGYMVNIDADGSILARTPDSKSRYIATQETDIDAMDRLMVKQGLENGAKVSFEADGSLVIDGSAGGTPPSAEHAAAMFAEFERLADAGDINAQLAAGSTYDFDVSTVPAPAAPTPLEDPFDTAAEVDAEVNSLQLGVDVAREMSLADFSKDKEAAELERVTAERRLAAANAERDVAEQQSTAAQAEAITTREAAAEMRVRAQKYRDAGDIAQADSTDADATSFEAIAAVNAKVAAEAQQAFDAADTRVTEEQEVVDQRTVASNEVNEKLSSLEKVYEDQESQVFYARQASDELKEAERLEAALPDLEAKGVAGLDRVHAAIAQHRASAEKFVEQSRIRQDTGITVTGELDENGIDPNLIEIEPNDPPAETPAEPPAEPPAETPTETPAGTPDNEIDPDLIEMEPNDPPAPAPAETTKDTSSDSPTEAPSDTPTEALTEPSNGVDPNLIEMEQPQSADFEPVGVSFGETPETDFSNEFSEDINQIEQVDNDLDGLTDA